MLGLNASGGITSKLTGQVGMNYAHRTTVGASSSTGDTVGVTVGARYLLGPVLASLTANWMYVSEFYRLKHLCTSSQKRWSC